MLTIITAIIFLIVAVLSVVLRKTYAVVPAHELKRQAAAGNGLARQLYRAVGFGASLQVLLWVVLALCSAAGFVLLATEVPALLSVLIVAVILWLTFSWLPNTRVTGIATQVTQKATPAVVWILQYIDPVLQRIAQFMAKHYVPKHSGLYELHDLLNLLDLQSKQPDSRITTEEISLIREVLEFGNKKVRDVLRPRQQVKSVALNDAIGPVLLDELHASGQTSFPVKKTTRSKEIVASLHLGDLGIHSVGIVQDYVTHGVTYIHESDSLADALHVFYQTKQQLFVVIDTAEEFVGVLTLEDVLHALVGPLSADETLGSHNDSAAVAARHSRKTDETVVE
ncbi:hypothetical protein BH09PAT3_BH09PAT3_1920 [soil metagenome]